MLNNIKKRHVLAIYAFFGYFVAYALRANLSVAIVDMSKTNLNTMERIEDDDGSSVAPCTCACIPPVGRTPVFCGGAAICRERWGTE